MGEGRGWRARGYVGGRVLVDSTPHPPHSQWPGFAGGEGWRWGGGGVGGLDQGCRLFLGYIQINWKDEKWQSHKGPQSRAADSEHIITRVPRERAVRRLLADRASALASCEPVRLTGKPIGVYIENKKKKKKTMEKWDRRPFPRLSACFFFFHHKGENGVWAYTSGNVKSVTNWLTQPN